MNNFANRTIAIALCFLLLLGACTSPQIDSSSPSKPEIIIGASIPLTGDQSMMGTGVKKGIELALKELEGKDLKFNYRVLFEDDKLDAKTSVTAATKLTSIDGAKALISISSGTGNAINPIAENNQAIHFGIASDSNVAKGVFNFIHWTPPSEEAKTFARYASGHGFQRVAVIGMQHPGIKAVIDSAVHDLEAAGVKAVFSESFNPGEQEFKTTLLKAETQKPDLYLLMAFDPELPLIYKQLKELGIRAPVTSIEAFELTSDPSIFEGYWYVNGADSTGGFNTAFESMHQSTPGVGSANAYDIVNLLVQGFEQAAGTGDGVPSTAQVVQQLVQIKEFNGALGTLSVGENHIVSSPAVVRVIKNGKPFTLPTESAPLTTPVKGESVKVGFIGALTGEAATYGTDDKNGVELAVEDINSNGGINGKPLEIVYEDSKCSGKDATTAVSKLLEVDGIRHIIGGSCSSEVLAVAPITEQASAILFTTMASNGKIRNAGDYVFRNMPNDDLTSRKLAEVISKDHTTVGIISENTDYAQGLRSVFTTEAKKLGLTISGDELFEAGAGDLRAQLIKIKEANPGALLINPQADATGGRILKQARELGLLQPSYIPWFGASKPLQEAAGMDAVEGLTWVDTPALDSSHVQGKSLLERHLKKYGKAPTFPFWFALSYDRTRVLANALNACGSESTTCARDYLYAMKPHVGIGGTFNFDKDGEVVGIAHAVYRIKDGKQVALN